jgi:hypothetical protein
VPVAGWRGSFLLSAIGTDDTVTSPERAYYTAMTLQNVASLVAPEMSLENEVARKKLSPKCYEQTIAHLIRS